MKIKYQKSILMTAILCVLYSCSSEYYEINDYYNVKKIDAHIHYLSYNNAFSELAQADNFMLIDINYDKNNQDSSLMNMEKMSLHQKNQFTDIFKYLTSFTLHGWDTHDWADVTIGKLKASFDNGAIGVKVWKNIGMEYKDSTGKFIMLNHPKFDKVINFIISENKVLLGHCGEPKNCWLPLSEMTTRGDKEYFGANPNFHMYLHSEYPSYEAQIQARDNLLANFPALNLVGAHLGSLEWSVDELAERFDKYPNFSVDISSRLAHIQLQSMDDYKKVRNFFIKYQDRLIYGTDEWIDEKKDPQDFKKQMHNIWIEQWAYLVTNETFTNSQIQGEYKGLKLPKKVIDKLYYGNALKWYKIK